MHEDIICIILDIFLLQRDAETIAICKSIDRTWYNIIFRYSNKYLKTAEMFMHALSSKPENKIIVNRSILKTLALTQFHEKFQQNLALIDPAIIGSNIMLDMEIFIPNPLSNSLEISKEYLPTLKKICDDWTSLYFRNHNEFHRAIKKLTSREDALTQEAYEKYYKDSNDINKITWLFMLINIIKHSAKPKNPYIICQK
jgi:hypothetical protein